MGVDQTRHRLISTEKQVPDRLDLAGNIHAARHRAITNQRNFERLSARLSGKVHLRHSSKALTIAGLGVDRHSAIVQTPLDPSIKRQGQGCIGGPRAGKLEVALTCQLIPPPGQRDGPVDRTGQVLTQRLEVHLGQIELCLQILSRARSVHADLTAPQTHPSVRRTLSPIPAEQNRLQGRDVGTSHLACTVKGQA